MSVTKEYVNGALNYTGSKYPIIDQIIPRFPRKIRRLYDPMCGEAVIPVNTRAKTVVVNDSQEEVVDVLHHFYTEDLGDILGAIDFLIDLFGLNKENSEGYYALRDYYNFGKVPTHLSAEAYEGLDHRHPILFYLLVVHSFSNQIRFNKKGEFNLPFGRRWFNPNLRKKLETFVKAWQRKQVWFYSWIGMDFREVAAKRFEILERFDENFLATIKYSLQANPELDPPPAYDPYVHEDFWYWDPPYSTGIASYNENGGWGHDDDRDLFGILDKLTELGQRWAMSNAVENRGVENELLAYWLRENEGRYTVYEIDHTYRGSNYQRNNKGTREVLVVNYD